MFAPRRRGAARSRARSSRPMGSKRRVSCRVTLARSRRFSLTESTRTPPSGRRARHKINDVRFLTTTAGERSRRSRTIAPIGDEWARPPPEMAGALLGRAQTARCASSPIAGQARRRRRDGARAGSRRARPRRVRVLADGGRVHAAQRGRVREDARVGVRRDATAGRRGRRERRPAAPCGNGCFTVALAPNGRRVVATEISKASVALAEQPRRQRRVRARSAAALSAEEFARAHAGERFKQLSAAGIRLDGGGGGGDARRRAPTTSARSSSSSSARGARVLRGRRGVVLLRRGRRAGGAAASLGRRRRDRLRATAVDSEKLSSSSLRPRRVGAR